MSATFVLAFSILIQIAAAVSALKLIPVTGRRKAWMCISAAIFLMAVRRGINLYEMLFQSTSLTMPPTEWGNAWVALITSILMLLGITGIVPLFESIRKASDALKASEEKYRRLFEESRDMIFIADARGRVLDVNRAASELLGYSESEILNSTVDRFFSSKAERRKVRDELDAQGYVRNVEITLVGRDGRQRECLASATAIREGDDAPRLYQGIVRDITHRKRMEVQLREKNKILDAILTASPIGICLVYDRTFKWVNRTMYNMLGYEPGTLDGENACLLYPHQDEYEHAGRELYDLTDTSVGGCVTTRWLRKDGTIFECLLHSSSLEPASPTEEGKIVAVVDITELKRTEKALRASEERYRRFFEDDLTGDYISTADGRLLTCNPALARILGFDSVEEAKQYDLRKLYPEEEARKEFWDLVRTQKKLDYHQRHLIRKDGRSVYVVENVIGIFDDHGELVEMKGYMFDNTPLKKLEEQFLHAQKMEAIGRLTGGIAHDFNNILTAITAYADSLEMKLPVNNPLHRYVGEIRRAADKAATLTRQLLTFSRKQIVQPKVLNLNTVVQDMEKMLRRLIGEDIELHTALSKDLGQVCIDPGQLEQVIMNLVVNARDAMPGGGRLTIETAPVTLDTTYARQHMGVQPGFYAMLAVSDTGTGMDSETLSHIFEPFFTTKSKDKGTGLGLATVYGIVQQSNGHVWVYSEPGGGSTFKIYLPLVAGDCQDTEYRAKALCPAIEGTETILVVEDDAMVREIVCENLRSNGYLVLEAANSEEAQERSAQHDGTIHLLLTDIIMPGINGYQLAEVLSARRPETKILFVSGYTDHNVLLEGVLCKGRAFLQKPFPMESLGRKIREMLDFPS